MKSMGVKRWPANVILLKINSEDGTMNIVDHANNKNIYKKKNNNML